MNEPSDFHSADFVRAFVANRTGLDLTNLSAAEEKIVRAVTAYVVMKKQHGSDATRTLRQLRNRGLLGAAEAAVAKAKPTQGFQALVGANLKALSYEQIVLDHPDEFSARAIWFSRRTLGLRNAIARPPAKPIEQVPRRAVPYWVFVCNPKRWAIDRFLARGIEHDTWGVRPSDRDFFAPGQLGIVRVGKDDRTAKERRGNPRLEPGIYALCLVESEVFGGTGARDEFWARGQERERGWPTVKLRYLQSFFRHPLTIERLRVAAPGVSHLLLDGFQASSFPIQAHDFRAVMELLGQDLDDLPLPLDPPDNRADQLVALENQYLNASPEVKEILSRRIERGPIGAFLKRATGYKCQVCAALGRDPGGFLKPNGERYVEAHHVMPVSKMQIGSIAAANVMIVCANHHRQLHYGGVRVTNDSTVFSFVIDGTPIKLRKFGSSDAIPP